MGKLNSKVLNKAAKPKKAPAKTVSKKKPAAKKEK
jgi:hypothetical protein